VKTGLMPYKGGDLREKSLFIRILFIIFLNQYCNKLIENLVLQRETIRTTKIKLVVIREFYIEYRV
jgi:hypothetical protein